MRYLKTGKLQFEITMSETAEFHLKNLMKMQSEALDNPLGVSGLPLI